jgi:hypothetical protein
MATAPGRITPRKYEEEKKYQPPSVNSSVALNGIPSSGRKASAIYSSKDYGVSGSTAYSSLTGIPGANDTQKFNKPPKQPEKQATARQLELDENCNPNSTLKSLEE